MSAAAFDPVAYKRSTTEQWDAAAEAWNAWGPTLERWLGEATELMLDMTRRRRGLAGARRRGRRGRADARGGAARGAGGQRAGDRHLAARSCDAPRGRPSASRLANVATRAMDGETLEVRAGQLRRGDLAARADLLPRPAARARRAAPRAAARRPRRRRSSTRRADRNGFFSIPVGVIRRRAALPAPAPGQPGPFSLGARACSRSCSKARVRRRRGAGAARAAADGLGRGMPALRARVLRRAPPDARGARRGRARGGLAGDRARAAAFEDGDGFAGPCELLVAAATAP